MGYGQNLKEAIDKKGWDYSKMCKRSAYETTNTLYHHSP